MPWTIWSPENFPKRMDDGALSDYAIAYRIQVILKAGEWTFLEPEGFYRDTYVQSWVDKEADAKEVVTSAKDVAVRICRDKGQAFPINGKFYPTGLMYCNTDHETPETIAKLEEEGKRRNLEFRKQVVRAYEIQFRLAIQGKPGRLTPTGYEQECYDILHLTPPEVVQRQQEPAAREVKVVEPDPEMIQQLVAAEVEKVLAAQKSAPRKI
jgi:hypothetical protein